MFDSFDTASRYWNDTPEVHTSIFRNFFDLVQRDPLLRQHRDYIESNNYGFGDRPFHWMWNLIAQDLPDDFKFLEIGVFQGQIISLISLLSQRYQKNGQIFALTPLKSIGDNFCQYIDIDYKARIASLFAEFKLDLAKVSFIEGISAEERAIDDARKTAPYHCVYIDGGHDYDTVVNDIQVFGKMVAPDGLLVMDDSANYLNIPDGLIPLNWRGITDVSDAVRDHLESNPGFKHIFSCGHNRIWRKL